MIYYNKSNRNSKFLILLVSNFNSNNSPKTIQAIEITSYKS